MSGVFDIRDYGATPSETQVQTKAIQAAIDAVPEYGGRVVIPAGPWLSGTIWLKSGVELYLAKGATLLGSKNPDDFPARDLIKEQVVNSRRVGPRRLVGAVNCEDIVITGPGTIDGQGGCERTLDTFAEAYPQNIQLVNCVNAEVSNVTLRDAGSWMQQYYGCEKLYIHNIKLWNHPGHHTNDGIDIDGCCDVRVSDCDVDSYDDALVFKSTGELACRNIVVTNCRLRSNCHGIKFGTESVTGFENIRITNCSVTASDVPAPLPTHPLGRPVITAVALECTDGGTMRHIHIDGITAEQVFCPILMKLGNRFDRRIIEEIQPGHGMMEDISIQNIHAREAGHFPCQITGYPRHAVKRVNISNVSVEHVGGAEERDILTEIPECNDSYPEINMFTKSKSKKRNAHLPAYGFFLRHAEDIRLNNIRFKLRSTDARKALHVDTGVKNLTVNEFYDAWGNEVTV